MTRGQRGSTVTIQNILVLRRLKLDSRFSNEVVVLIFMLFFLKMSILAKLCFLMLLTGNVLGNKSPEDSVEGKIFFVLINIYYTKKDINLLF